MLESMAPPQKMLQLHQMMFTKSKFKTLEMVTWDSCLVTLMHARPQQPRKMRSTPNLMLTKIKLTNSDKTCFNTWLETSSSRSTVYVTKKNSTIDLCPLSIIKTLNKQVPLLENSPSTTLSWWSRPLTARITTAAIRLMPTTMTSVSRLFALSTLLSSSTSSVPTVAARLGPSGCFPVSDTLTIACVEPICASLLDQSTYYWLL